MGGSREAGSLQSRGETISTFQPEYPSSHPSDIVKAPWEMRRRLLWHLTLQWGNPRIADVELAAPRSAIRISKRLYPCIRSDKKLHARSLKKLYLVSTTRCPMARDQHCSNLSV
jgi:hypothetical protein